jgi:hypothetical protein
MTPPKMLSANLAIPVGLVTLIFLIAGVATFASLASLQWIRRGAVFVLKI